MNTIFISLDIKKLLFFNSPDEKTLVITNNEVDNINITLKDSNYQNIYKMLDSALTELNSENNITPYQIIEKIDQHSKNENIEVTYTHLKRTGEISLNEVKDEYKKTDDNKDMDKRIIFLFFYYTLYIRNRLI